MLLSKLTLNPQECHALLEAVVDCDHDLYKRIKDCAKTYSDNPDAHLFEQKVMEKFKKIVSIDRIEIKNTEIVGNNEGLIIRCYDVDMDIPFTFYYHTETDWFSKT